MVANREKVSAIITTRNRIELLKRAISSVFDQTYNNIECIVVSDNSTDDTNEYCSHLEGIVYIPIPEKESCGGNHARNVGLKAATGEYVAFLDDDDCWKPTKIEKQLNTALLTKCDYIYCGITLERIIDGNPYYTDVLPSKEGKGNVSKLVLQEILTTTSSIFVKKELVIDAGLFDEKLGFWQEYELTIRLAQLTNFNYVNEPLTVYRLDAADPNRLTNKFHKWLDAVDYVYEKHRDLYSKLNRIEKIHAKRLFWYDAKSRCENAQISSRVCYYKIMIRISNKLESIVNLFIHSFCKPSL